MYTFVERKNLESFPQYLSTISRYHQVTSVGSNIAVNIWWKHLRSFIPRQCDNIPPGATLDQFYFNSLEKNGDDDGDSEGGDEPSLL